MDILNFTAPSGSTLVNIIYWLVSICSSVAVGVILFTFILKLITLPFDYVSRLSMRKNSIKMEQMRPELEKLQRQYADNKELYNQKMMALYKKNGYSMFGACLPTILTLVIFIVAINAFTDYSYFQNQKYFYNMTTSYNNVVYAGFDIDESGQYIYRNEKGKFIVNYENIKDADAVDNDNKVSLGNNIDITYSDAFFEDRDGKEIYKFSLYTTNSYVEYAREYYEENGQKVWLKESYSVREEGLNNPVLASEENNELKVKVNGEKLTYSEVINLPETTWNKDKFILDIRQEKSAETYRDEQQSFFWVKNIWVTDSTMSHPIQSDWSTFKTTHKYSGSDIGKDGYSNLIAKLDYEKTAPNGYFILILLTAGSSLVMQLVMGKAQKAQMELQTVNGQGMQTQKMMQWLMPIMMAFFAFMYTAAFSIYIVVNSLISIGTTFAINYIADKQMAKESNKNKEQQKIRGRVYVPKQEDQIEKKKNEKTEKKKQKDDKFAHQSGGDFLTGKVKVKKRK